MFYSAIAILKGSHYKIHLAADTYGNPAAIEITGGQGHGCKFVVTLIRQVIKDNTTIAAADKAYSKLPTKRIQSNQIIKNKTVLYF